MAVQKSISRNWAPNIDLQMFREGQLAGRDDLLFHELHGKRKIDKPHTHDFFTIILFERASGIHNIDSIDYPAGNQEVHVLFPGQLHKWDIKEGTVGYQLMAERAFFEQFAPFFRFSFTNYQNHPVIKLTDQAFALFMQELDGIKNELSTDDPLVQLIYARTAVIAAIVSKAAEHLFTEFKVYQSNPKLARYNTLIDEFYREKHTVSFYAEKLNITANYLNIICKKHLKVPATQLIHQRLSTEAKRLLQKGNLTVKEITFELGFADQSYFAHFFKMQTGMTPTEFREKL